MAEVNKAQKRQSGHNKSKYAAQYGVTYNNKRKAINAHIANLETVLAVLKAAEAMSINTERKKRKMENIKASIAAAMDALKSLPLKK